MNQWRTCLTCDDSLLPLCCQRSCSVATGLDVCLLPGSEPRQSACGRSQPGRTGESAVHPPQRRAFTSPRMRRAFTCALGKSGVRASPKTSRLRGRLLCCGGNCSFQAGRWRSSRSRGCDVAQVSLFLTVSRFCLGKCGPFIYSLVILV